MTLQAKSYDLRLRVLDMLYRAKTGHIGGDFSVCDILNVLYNRVMDVTPENFSTVDHDHFILSKGHSVEALYILPGGGPALLLSVWQQVHRPPQQQGAWYRDELRLPGPRPVRVGGGHGRRPL